MPIGTVKFFNDSKGYGFIQPDDGGNDAFVHITAVERAGMRSLKENQRLSYDLQQDRPGKTSAVNLQLSEQTDQSPQPLGQAEHSPQPEVSAEQAEQSPQPLGQAEQSGQPEQSAQPAEQPLQAQ